MLEWLIAVYKVRRRLWHRTRLRRRQTRRRSPMRRLPTQPHTTRWRHRRWRHRLLLTTRCRRRWTPSPLSVRDVTRQRGGVTVNVALAALSLHLHA